MLRMGLLGLAPARAAGSGVGVVSLTLADSALATGLETAH